MESSYDIDEASKPKLPSTQHDIRQAKQFLMKYSSESNENLYDHLSELLAKILAERPKNAVDIFEDYSQQLKIERFKKTSGIREIYVPPLQYEEAQCLLNFFKTTLEQNNVSIVDKISNESSTDFPNLLELLYYLEQLDISLSRSEMVLLNLTIHKNIMEKPIKNVRFWGKIFGRLKNYYIIEAELNDEELSRRLQLDADEKNAMMQSQVQDDDDVKMNTNLQKHNVNVEVEVDGGVSDTDGGINGTDVEKNKRLDLVFPSIPTKNRKLPPVISTEQIGTGINKMIYFVCNSPGLDEWIELPSVTPQQIVAARQIVQCFTGCLETPISTFPEFPGNEGNYLRAQIARISASTHVSPIGYFIFGKESNEGEEQLEEEFKDEEIEEDEEIRDSNTITENQHYIAVPVMDLVDSLMSNWCHHTEYILEQGRTTWWDISTKDVNEEELYDEAIEEEEEEEEEEEMEDEIIDNNGKKSKKEIGPPLLTPLSSDVMIDTMEFPWTGRLSSEIQQETAIAMIRSNVWPGAIAFAKDKVFGNVYIGWGHKFNPSNYSPSRMPLIQDQYKLGPEIMEIQDPSIDAEGDYQSQHFLPHDYSESDEEEEEEEEEEEDDDEDDDDDDMTDY